MIYVKQCTIVWYVDDNKLSHVDTNVVTDIIEEIKNHFGDLVISRGDTHDFLGINIKIMKDKKVELMMGYQTEDTSRQFKNICDFNVTSPCSQNLWDVNNEAELFYDVKDNLFHLLTSKLLYITERTRPDIEPAVALLTKWVVKSNVDGEYAYHT